MIRRCLKNSRFQRKLLKSTERSIQVQNSFLSSNLRVWSHIIEVPHCMELKIQEDTSDLRLWGLTLTNWTNWTRNRVSRIQNYKSLAIFVNPKTQKKRLKMNEVLRLRLMRILRIIPKMKNMMDQEFKGFGSPDKIAFRHRQITDRHGERQSCIFTLGISIYSSPFNLMELDYSLTSR